MNLIRIITALILAVLPVAATCCYAKYRGQSGRQMRILLWAHWTVTGLILVGYFCGALSVANWRLSPIVCTAFIVSMAFLRWAITKQKTMQRAAGVLCEMLPFVRQYGIIEIYQLKSLTKGGIFMPKGQPNKRYTPEFKIKVVETMHREKLSYRETARQFDIPNSRVTAWERIYLEEGAEGLYVERRGRKSTGRSPKIKKEVEEDLIAEVQRLRAENAYLKN